MVVALLMLAVPGCQPTADSGGAIDIVQVAPSPGTVVSVTGSTAFYVELVASDCSDLSIAWTLDSAGGLVAATKVGDDACTERQEVMLVPEDVSVTDELEMAAVSASGLELRLAWEIERP